MCSIAGIISNKEIDIKKMIVVQQHRSPDDSNYYVDNDIQLAMGRLKIIDLVSAGLCLYQDDNYVMSYNGEIYNYKQRLYRQRQRTRQGHRHAAMRTFATRGDSARLPRHAIQPGRLNQRRCDPPVAEAGFCHCRDPARSV